MMGCVKLNTFYRIRMTDIILSYPLIGLTDDIIEKALGHFTGSVLGSLQRMVQVAF